MDYVEVAQFRFNDTTLQTFVKDGEVWFRMMEVCEAIAHSSPAIAARGLDGDEKRTIALPSSGRIQNQIVVSESGLYHFLIKSQLPLAVAFVAGLPKKFSRASGEMDFILGQEWNWRLREVNQWTPLTLRALRKCVAYRAGIWF